MIFILGQIIYWTGLYPWHSPWMISILGWIKSMICLMIIILGWMISWTGLYLWYALWYSFWAGFHPGLNYIHDMLFDIFILGWVTTWAGLYLWYAAWVISIWAGLYLWLDYPFGWIISMICSMIFNLGWIISMICSMILILGWIISMICCLSDMNLGQVHNDDILCKGWYWTTSALSEDKQTICIS